MEETMETTVDTEMESTQEDLFDWGEAGQGEEQQEQNDQSVGQADGGAGQGQPQAESSVDAQGAPEPEEATVTVKFYGKEHKLPMSQVQTLAQKGMVFDTLSQKLDAAMPAYNLMEQYAKAAGMSLEQYLQMAQEGLARQSAAPLVKAGMPEKEAMELSQLRQQKAQWEQAMAQQRANDQAAAQKQARQQQFVELLERYPEVSKNGGTLPDEVMADIARGESPVHAYERYELAQLKAQLAAQKAAQKNRDSAPGSASGLGAQKAADPFMAGWDSED